MTDEQDRRIAELEEQVKLLTDERDLFRDQAIPEAAQIMNRISKENYALAEVVRHLEGERDRLRDDLIQVREEHKVTWGDWKLQRERAGQAENERDRLLAIVEALALFADHAEDCAVEVGYPCNCGLDRIHAQLDGSAEATDG